jgi:hypothetical protein
VEPRRDLGAVNPRTQVGDEGAEEGPGVDDVVVEGEGEGVSHGTWCPRGGQVLRSLRSLRMTKAKGSQ